MGAKFAKSFGNDVYCLSRSEWKKKWADEYEAGFVRNIYSFYPRSINDLFF